MGWWSATVLGGDTPLDYLGELAEDVFESPRDLEAKGDCYYGHHYTREILESKLDKAVKHLENDTYSESYVGFQVLGAMLLEVGADIPNDVREKIIDAAEKDEWAKSGDEERIFFMQDLIDKIRAHKPGQQTELANESLFEAWERAVGYPSKRTGSES
jgi:hypothetical protein